MERAMIKLELAKAGRNEGPSQITTRPPPPAPIPQLGQPLTVLVLDLMNPMPGDPPVR